MIPHWKKGTGPRVKNAQKTTLDVGGKPHTFPSKAEALRYLDLERMQKAGIVKEIELQPKFILRPAYSKCCHDVISNPASKGICHFCGKKMPKTPAWTYRADFRITWADGTQTIEDVKGFETEMFREKKRQFEYKFPELTLIMTSGVVRTDNPYLAALIYQYRSLMPETYQMLTNDYHENLMDFAVCCDYLEAKIDVMEGLLR